jgi:hypothetical protein
MPRFQRYGDTEIYAYWQRYGMREAHTCVSCEKRLSVRTLVTVAPFMDEDDGGAFCVPCSDELYNSNR